MVCLQAIDGATSEFKLVKKVAELTQVVHMLFRSSHCLETELSLAKERSTQEVNRLINTYDSQVNELQVQIKEKDERIKGELFPIIVPPNQIIATPQQSKNSVIFLVWFFEEQVLVKKDSATVNLAQKKISKR